MGTPTMDPRGRVCRFPPDLDLFTRVSGLHSAKGSRPESWSGADRTRRRLNPTVVHRTHNSPANRMQTPGFEKAEREGHEPFPSLARASPKRAAVSDPCFDQKASIKFEDAPGPPLSTIGGYSPPPDRCLNFRYRISLAQKQLMWQAIRKQGEPQEKGTCV